MREEFGLEEQVLNQVERTDDMDLDGLANGLGMDPEKLRFYLTTWVNMPTILEIADFLECDVSIRLTKNRFGPALREARNNYCLTVKQLSQVLDISPTYLKEVETEKRIGLVPYRISLLPFSSEDCLRLERLNSKDRAEKTK